MIEGIKEVIRKHKLPFALLVCYVLASPFIIDCCSIVDYSTTKVIQYNGNRIEYSRGSGETAVFHRKTRTPFYLEISEKDGTDISFYESNENGKIDGGDAYYITPPYALTQIYRIYDDRIDTYVNGLDDAGDRRVRTITDIDEMNEMKQKINVEYNYWRKQIEEKSQQP